MKGNLGSSTVSLLYRKAHTLHALNVRLLGTKVSLISGNEPFDMMLSEAMKGGTGDYARFTSYITRMDDDVFDSVASR